MENSYVYIMTNKHRTTFYIGVTSNLSKRVVERQMGNGSKSTKKYNLVELIYYETYSDIEQAIEREKQLKNWLHEWKINLIKKTNPKLKTLDY